MSFFTIILLFLILVLLMFLYLYTWTGLKVRKMMKLLPGYSESQSWSIVIKALNLATEGLKDFLEDIFADCTSLRCVWFNGQPNVFINSPKNLEALLKSVQHITKGVEYHSLSPWLGKGLLTSTGTTWHANRKMLTPAFHFKILTSALPIFNANGHLLTKILKKRCSIEEIMHVDHFISLCSLDIMSEAAMGVRLNAQLNNPATIGYVKAVRRMAELVITRTKAFYLQKDWIFNMTSEGREQKKVLHTLHTFTENVIKESKKKRLLQKTEGPAAFVDLLLETAESQPGFFTEIEIRQEVDTFMFEGHETTSSSITWSILLLGHNSEIQERAYNELVDIFGRDERPITTHDMGRMIYLEAVIKESLRLYPPVSYLTRYLDTDLELEKHVVPAGVNVIVMPYFLHRQSDLYPDPETFNPDRFMNVDKLNRNPFMYIPFSGGPRNCIGQKFAMMEMKILLAYILRNFKIESVTPREGLKLLFSPILRPMNGTCIKLYPRVQ